MELLNAVQRFDPVDANARAIVNESLEIAVLALAPIVPHVTHALWHALGHKQTLAYEAWPKYDPALVKADEVEV